MEVVVIVLAVFAILAGFVGCVFPVIPGPTLSYISLLLLHFFTQYTFSTTLLWVLGATVVVVAVLEYWLQIYGVKKFGGGKKAIYATMAGLLIGLFFIPVVGFVVGPFLGALVGGLLEAPGDFAKAFKIAFGALLGFFSGTFLKLAVCIYMAVEFVLVFKLF